MADLAEQFVGRDAELEALDAALADVEGGRAVAVEVLGEPGIGKSRLLAELGRRADARGHLVLAGRASELERDIPFWVFADALEPYVQALDPRRLASLDEDVRAQLRHVLPALEAPGVDAALAQERYRTHRAVRLLLELLAATRPLVLALDDLHWADDGSVELAGALLRRPPARVLLALAVRPRQAPERLRGPLERAARDGTLVRLQLGALTLEEARGLVGDSAPDLQALYAESGGNPFYLEQLARSLRRAPRDGARAQGASLAGVDVPSAVAFALTEELSLLSAPARRVLEGAAVAGDPFELDVAAAAVALPEREVLDSLDELWRLDLVGPDEVPRRFRFRHPLVRRAVYEATPAGWRLGAHERAAALLAERGAAAAARAHHVERSARHGDAAAVAVLREAGEAAAQSSPATAAHWFAAALRLLSATAPAQERVALLLARAAALTATGRLAESHELLVESLALAPPESWARITVACAGVEHLLGRFEQSQQRLTAALDALGERSSPQAVELMIELASWPAFHRGDFDAMRAWAARALEAAEALGDRVLIAAACAEVALAHTAGGTTEQASAARDRAASILDALSDGELARRLVMTSHRVVAEIYLERYAEATAHARRGITIGRATAQGELLPLLTPALGVASFIGGHVNEARDLLKAAVEAARLSGSMPALLAGLTNLAWVAGAAGDVQAGLAAAHEAMALTDGADAGQAAVHSAFALAYVLGQTGEPARAAQALLDRGGGVTLPAMPHGRRVLALELLTRCLLACGRREEALGAADAARATAAEIGLPVAGAVAGRAAAALALDRGDTADAAQRALAAAAAAEAAGAPVEAAITRLLAGQALARGGDGARAGEELTRAATQLDACDARGYRLLAERELRALGHRVQRRPRAAGAGLEALTERELELARLVVDRKTNAQIAAELFLSTKTVETHMRNMFVKLGVTSRVELARAVERGDRPRVERRR